MPCEELRCRDCGRTWRSVPIRRLFDQGVGTCLVCGGDLELVADRPPGAEDTSRVPQAGRRIYAATSPICRAGLEEILDSLGFEVVAIDDGREDVMPAIRRARAEIALLDVGVPGVDASVVLRELAPPRSDLAIVFTALAPRSADVYRAIAGGAAGFLSLGGTTDDLRGDLRRIGADPPVVSSGIALMLADEILAHSDLTGDA